MQRRRRHVVGTGTGAALLALMIAAPLVLSACSNGNSGSSSSARSVANPGAAKQGAADSGSANTAAGSAAQPNALAQTNGTGAAVVPAPRSMIITAGLQVKTDDAAAAAARAQVVVQGAGGFVAGESIGSGSQQVPATSQGSSSGDGTATGTLPSPTSLPDVSGASDTTQALLILRVPPAQLDAVMAALAGKGSVTYQSRTATDVTGQVADVASRVTSAQDSIAELRTLIDKAASMNDLISLEQALAQRESDLESLQAQSKALADQVQYATITVGYYSQGAPAPAPAVRTGFMRGLTVGWHAFTRTVRAVLVVLGWLVPYAALVAVLWWPVRWLVRRNRARGHGAPTAAVLAPAGPPAPDVTVTSTASEPPASSSPDE